MRMVASPSVDSGAASDDAFAPIIEARALVAQPAIVWGDEPTGNLDSVNADEIMRVMCDLNERNQQIFVLVTHDPRIGALCDRIIRMKDGRIVSDWNNVHDE